MDRVQYVLVGLPLFLFFSDIFSLFTTSPPPPSATKPSHNHHHHHHHQVDPVTVPDFPSQNPSAAIIGEHVATGNTININFCSSCSYKGTAVTMKNMLEIAFPGTEVVLANYPAPLPKRLLSKVVPVLQFGVIGVVIGGEQIFPMLGFVAPPSWFNSLRANKFGTIASTWLLGNALQSFLNSSGAFEVYFNGELVFSKLKEGRSPGEIELKDLISRRMANSKLAAFQGEGDSYSTMQE